ncbi:Ribosomal RNA small subunit methyltransferase H [bacterium HR19]|nr:Ribosomal RNA small subunit methyltransferase H [bacterium HR19]
MHIPVLKEEVIRVLSPKRGDFVVDLTAGGGGHSVEFAKRLGKEGILVLIDWDEEMIEKAEEKISEMIDEKDRPEIFFITANFADIDEIFSEIQIDRKPDIFFADLGISSFHLEESLRGFSFRLEGPLDMRISKSIKLTAREVVMNFSERQLADIIYRYGEERLAKKIAKEIVRRRKERDINTTTELAEIVESVYKKTGIYNTKIHPATKTFQALRIFVNRELDNLSDFLQKVAKFVKSGTKIGIISFHSLEDRIVKRTFLSWEKDGLGRRVTKKPIVPSEEEMVINPRSRSAKFRAFEFL